jgi:hypothetical protein
MASEHRVDRECIHRWASCTVISKLSTIVSSTGARSPPEIDIAYAKARHRLGSPQVTTKFRSTQVCRHFCMGAVYLRRQVRFTLLPATADHFEAYLGFPIVTCQYYTLTRWNTSRRHQFLIVWWGDLNLLDLDLCLLQERITRSLNRTSSGSIVQVSAVAHPPCSRQFFFGPLDFHQLVVSNEYDVGD